MQVHVSHGGRGHWLSLEDGSSLEQIVAAVQGAYPGGVVLEIKRGDVRPGFDPVPGDDPTPAGDPTPATDLEA